MRIPLKLRVLLAGLLLFPAASVSFGQVPENDPYLKFGVRLSVNADYKIRKGLHLSGETELREGKDILSEGYFQNSVGLSYKVSPYFKTAASYTLIGKRTSLSSYNFRHRGNVDLTASLPYGSWKFSLRERFQMTNRPGEMNRYQNPRNLLELKSRLKEEYSFNKRFSQYSFIEVRAALNKASLTGYHYDAAQHKYVDGQSNSVGEPGWFFDGYGDCYFNRIRLCLGLEYERNKRRTYDFYLYGDYYNNLKIDASSDGTALKSLVHDRYYKITPGISYKYSF